MLGQAIFGHNQDKNKVANVGTLVLLFLLDDLPTKNQNSSLSYVPPYLELSDVILTSDPFNKADFPSAIMDLYSVNNCIRVSTIDDSAKDGGPHFTQCMIGICPPSNA